MGRGNAEMGEQSEVVELAWNAAGCTWQALEEVVPSDGEIPRLEIHVDSRRFQRRQRQGGTSVGGRMNGSYACRALGCMRRTRFQKV